ncbi:MAG: DUF2971 domain-containing protein [Saprospiraceae bacterium]|nr:DUF2971 domain-containing protein [Saprospiraceae bacterium]
MWSHYSNFHGGFCVGFNSMSLYKTIGGMISKVKYQKEFPTHGIFDDDIEFTQKHLFTKSLIWEYEDEFRIIKYEPSQRIINFSRMC